MEYNIYRKKVVVNNENNIQEAKKISFILGVVGFFMMVFMPLFGIIISAIGLYYGFVGKKKLYLLMNLFVLIASVVLICLTLQSITETQINLFYTFFKICDTM